jgi:hypothetical protein
MKSLKSWGFICLIVSLLLITLSMTIFTGGWAMTVGFIAVVLGILSGGLYGASTQRK